MIRVMCDSDTPDAMPRNVPLIATYADLVTDLAAFRARRPGQQVILIDRGLGDPTGQASVIDVERGSLKPSDVPGWYDKQHARAIPDLSAYVNRSNLPAVDAAAGGRPIFRWVATLDGTLFIPGYAPEHAPAAIQAIPAAWAGIHADFSLVYEDQWHADPETSRLDVARGDARQAQADLGHAAQSLAMVVSALNAIS